MNSSPSYWSTERVKFFVVEAMDWFDREEIGFGDLIPVSKVLEIAGLDPHAQPSTPDEYRDKQLVELRLLSAFKEALLERRNRCLKQQNTHLRVLHPEEQMEYGEVQQAKIALQKLRKGARIVEHTDTNDVQKKQDAIARLGASENWLRRQMNARKHPF